ncbi:hypothetical protein [Sporichthya polymorpha]|uniref:hypothetical protein n=1 Tax=Sporichthya polymorpha TaxID=35751 RepID=UPI00036690D7|nr:hypothetical protein [Sporichthya polymorpha]
MIERIAARGSLGGWAVAAAAVAGLLGLIGLLGWAIGVEVLHTPVPRGGDMKPGSAGALALVGLGLVAPARTPRALALAGAAAPSAICTAEYLGTPGLALDASGHMPLATAVCVLLLVLAAATERRSCFRQLTAIGAGSIGGLVLVGYTYGTHSLTHFSHASMSVPAAVAVVLLTFAVLARTPTGWLPWVWSGTDAGAAMLRRALPPVVLGMPALTFLHLQGERLFWEDERVTEAFFVTLLVVAVSALLLRIASSLRLLDHQREQARRDLVALNNRLVGEVRGSYASLRSAKQRIGSLEDSQRAVLTVHDDVLQSLFASGLMLRTALDGSAPDASVQRTLDCMDDAVRAIRVVVENLNDHLAAG